MPIAQRGMILNDIRHGGESFWPTITQTPDGEIHIVGCSGSDIDIVQVKGLETIRRLPEAPLEASPDDLKKARASMVESEALRLENKGCGILKVALRAAAPVADGKLDDWSSADRADIDKSGTAAWFDSGTRPYDVRTAIAVADNKLWLAYKTGDADLLRNSGETPNAPFKNGGALDLMIAANPQADPKRSAPVEGDMRLVVTKVKDKTLALLYRAVVPDTKDKMLFSSPVREITMDKVEGISAQVQLAGTDGNYEVSVPLATLGLRPAAGQAVRGDIDILRRNGFRTLHRVYWNNKATAITEDVPSEAELTPALWGRWEFRE